MIRRVRLPLRSDWGERYDLVAAWISLVAAVAVLLGWRPAYSTVAAVAFLALALALIKDRGNR